MDEYFDVIINKVKGNTLTFKEYEDFCDFLYYVLQIEEALFEEDPNNSSKKSCADIFCGMLMDENNPSKLWSSIYNANKIRMNRTGGMGTASWVKKFENIKITG